MGTQKQSHVFEVIILLLIIAFAGSTAIAWKLHQINDQREAAEPVISPPASCLLYGKFCEPDGVCFTCTVI
jgi:hypothetical protein